MLLRCPSACLRPSAAVMSQPGRRRPAREAPRRQRMAPTDRPRPGQRRPVARTPRQARSRCWPARATGRELSGGDNLLMVAAPTPMKTGSAAPCTIRTASSIGKVGQSTAARSAAANSSSVPIEHPTRRHRRRGERQRRSEQRCGQGKGGNEIPSLGRRDGKVAHQNGQQADDDEFRRHHDGRGGRQNQQRKRQVSCRRWGWAVHALAPPSMFKPAPLMKRPSAPATKATSAAISSGLP